MTTLLALDTATEACSVALLHDGKVLSHYEVAPRLHAQRLLPMIQELLGEAGLALSALDAIAFGRGPGAFTGVRIAIGVVQGLAFALDRPVLPVSNLAVLAQRALREHGAQQVAAAIDARMDEVYFGHYALVDGVMTLVGEEVVSEPAALVQARDKLTGAVSCVGTGFETYGETLGGLADVLMPSQVRFPAAADMLPLARQAWFAGEAVPVEQATPVYLRDKVTWKKLPGRE